MAHKFDIFISYARKDFDEVNQFVGMLKERIPSLTCWFDITGIESGDEFEDKIITAINNSAYVLFALSDHSIQSQWTKDEVMYAKNTEKRIIPLLLKGAQLKGWFLFKFGRIDCIDTTNSLQIDKLVKNLSDWTGKRVVSASASEAKPNPSEVSGTKMQSMKEEISNDSHEAVDLGLSVKWATCNVGAASPSDYGDYFAWGEIKKKNRYSMETYQYWDNEHERFIYKDKGIESNISGTEYDAAHIKWGNGWRIPTLNEIEEIIYLCTWEWTEINGISGQKVTGPNGNSIFFPATGYYWDKGHEGFGSYGLYRGATYSFDGNGYANDFSFKQNEHDWLIYSDCYMGLPIRPVCD